MAGFASGKNWGTSPDKSVFTSDVQSATRIATSGSFSRYLTEQIVENSAMIQSGLIATDARLNNITGVLVELPFFDQLDYTEENVDSSNKWGTITSNAGRYTTQKHSASTQYSPIVTRGAAFAADMLHQYETGEQALQNISSQLTRKINKDITSKVISQLTGLFGTALAGNSLNIAAATTVAPKEENYLTAASVTQAKYLLGEKTAQQLMEVAEELERAGLVTEKDRIAAAYL